MSNAPIETKVKASAVTAGVTALVVSLLGTYAFHGAAPDWVGVLVGTLVTAAATFAAGWLARHSARPSDVPGVPAPVTPIVPPSGPTPAA